MEWRLAPEWNPGAVVWKCCDERNTAVSDGRNRAIDNRHYRIRGLRGMECYRSRAAVMGQTLHLHHGISRRDMPSTRLTEPIFPISLSFYG